MSRALQRAERAATGVGIITVVAGAALTAAPGATGRAVGVPGGADVGLRVIGVADLVIAAGLLVGRPRWPWMAARAAANPPSAAYLAVLGRRHRSSTLLPVAAVIALLTAADLHACRDLRAAGR